MDKAVLIIYKIYLECVKSKLNFVFYEIKLLMRRLLTMEFMGLHFINYFALSLVFRTPSELGNFHWHINILATNLKNNNMLLNFSQRFMKNNKNFPTNSLSTKQSIHSKVIHWLE